MDIYLDIDGTIKDTAAPMEDVIALLKYCLDHFHVYWLTTHCRGGENRTYGAIDFLPEDLQIRAFREIRTTDWNVLKTDGINFDNRFVWLDDTVMQAELEVLKEHDAEYGLFKIEPWDPCCLKDALKYIKTISG